MSKKIKANGHIYSLNERYLYVHDKELNIKARINRKYFNKITKENFLSDFDNLPNIHFEYIENLKTDNEIFIGFVRNQNERGEWEARFIKNGIYSFNLCYLDDYEFKIEFEGKVYSQKFPNLFTSLKIYLCSCFNSEESTVQLRYKNWDLQKEAPIFEYPYIVTNESPNKKVEAEIIYVREGTFKRNSWLRDVFYLKDNQNYIYRVDYPWFFDYKKYLNVGDSVELNTKKVDKYEKLIISEFEFERITKVKKQYAKGYELIAKVINPQPNGAICITEDDEVFFLSKQKVTKQINKVDISTVLSPADEILVSYESNSLGEINREHREFNFIKLENRIFESGKLKDILDLKVTYTKGISGGYSRNSDFREMVLNYYSHYCALCDDNLMYNKYSSGEAAHIVPRSSRGVNKLENALCLCKEHHWSFDRGFWSIDDNATVVLSDTLINDSNFMAKYEKFNGKKISKLVCEKISSDALEWHRKNIFKT